MVNGVIGNGLGNISALMCQTKECGFNPGGNVELLEAL